jgi:bifunctional non-homologous end joining protein LigD
LARYAAKPRSSRPPIGRWYFYRGFAYLSRTVRQYEYQPCIPTRGTKVPSGPDWLHEIKHDGYRLIVQREGKRVRLLTRRGYDWSDRYPLITQAALRVRKESFVIDGEAVVLGPDGISDFEGLHSRKCNEDVRLYAFDLLSDDGVDMRDETLQIRKLWLVKRSSDGIIYNEHEAGPIGPRLFEQACLMGLEGIVSKRRDRGYKAGLCKDWIKVKNPKSAAMVRAKEGEW